MSASKSSLFTLLLASLVGCQSSDTSSSLQPQSTTHPSQAVYLVEFESANQFLAASEQLQAGFNAYCQKPDSAQYQRLQGQWQDAMQSWMALQGQERGPLAALEQNWNVQFWPDKKDTTGRKMAELLKQHTPVSAQTLGAQSVTVQGLGALEWLLYDPAANLPAQPDACQLGLAISQNLANKALIIANAWQKNPWAELDEASWNAEYIALLSNQLEFSMSKLSRPLANIGQPRPYFAESWRSKTSMRNLKANLVAMNRLYLAKLDHQLRERGDSELADRIGQHFIDAIETWPEQASLFDMLITRQGYQSALAQYNKLEQLKYLIHEEVATKLQIVIGFNSTDGD